MIVSVARQLRWTPDILGSLYVDDIDYMGLEFWYNDVIKVSNEVKESINKK